MLKHKWIRWYRDAMLYIGCNWLYITVGKPCDTVKQHYRLEFGVFSFYISFDVGFAIGINPLD